MNKNRDQLKTAVLVEESKTEVLCSRCIVPKVAGKYITPGVTGGYKWTPDGGMFRSSGKEDDFSLNMQRDLEQGDAESWAASKAVYRILGRKY